MTELEQQEKEIGNKLAYVFIPIIIVIGGILFFQENSISHLRTEYEKFKYSEFNGTIKFMKKDTYKVGDLFLENGKKIRVLKTIYEKLNIGDKVHKIKASDSLKFITKNGNVFFFDENEFKREKYLRKKVQSQ